MHQILPELFPFWWKLGIYCIVETNLCRTLKLNIYFLYEKINIPVFLSINNEIISLYSFLLSVTLSCGRDISEPFEIWSWYLVYSILTIWRYCQSYFTFYENLVPIVSWKPICVGPWNLIYTFYMKNKQTRFFFCDWSINTEIIFLSNSYIRVYDIMLWT